MRPGGHLVVTVPAINSLASKKRSTSKIQNSYTPESLLAALEQSLGGDSFTLRHLSLSNDHDEVIAVVKKSEFVRPSNADSPSADVGEAVLIDRDFEPRRTRLETMVPRAVDRILLLKLDHLGDFIMGMPALQLVRRKFPNAHLTLVVGSWNERLARESGVADEIILFDAFPRNSSLETVDLAGRASAFAKAIDAAYDLAIDLRTDPDTRFFLKHVDASVRAGLGTRAQFPFLDIFLPIDLSRHEPETAREDIINPGAFSAQSFCSRTPFRIHCALSDVSSRLGAVVWGPYLRLAPGRYFFEPYIDFDEPHDGFLLVDVAFNCERHIAKTISARSDPKISFQVSEAKTLFEFRIFEPEQGAPMGFNFYGGRLVREGANSVLHQSEYQLLLIELVSMRIEQGLLTEISPTA